MKLRPQSAMPAPFVETDLLGVPAPPPEAQHQVKIQVDQLSVWYGETKALEDVALAIPPAQVTALVGPSGCGKSTFLRALNRMNDTIAGARVEGRVAIDGQDVYGRGVEIAALRCRIGLLSERPHPFRHQYLRTSRTVARQRLAATDADLYSRVEAACGRGRCGTSERPPHARRGRCPGARQRLCLAPYVGGGPGSVLMDEPARCSIDCRANDRVD